MHNSTMSEEQEGSLYQPAKGVVFMLLTTFIASTAAASVKYISSAATVEQIVFIQYLICLILLAPLIKSSQQLYVIPSDRWAMLIRASSGLICFYSYFWAVRHISLAEATLLRNSAPLLVPVIALWWLRTYLSGFNILMLVTGFVGIFIMLNPNATSPNLGHLAALVSAMALAVSIVSTRRLAHTSNTQAILFYYYLLSALGMLPLALHSWQPIALEAWPLIIYIGISIHAALYLYTKALTYASTVIIAPITYFSVVYTGLFDWILWQQAPSWLSISGMVLVTAAGIISTTVATQRKEQKEKDNEKIVARRGR